MNESKECPCREHWVQKILVDYWDDINEYDQDCHEWIFDIGNDYPRNVQEFLVGLKMAYEQLKEK